MTTEHQPPGHPPPGAYSQSAGVQDLALCLADGRRVRYLELGDRTGLPVIALHGTPGSRLRFAQAHLAAKAAGIRLIAPDRWGYGGTDSVDAPSFEAYARDVAEIADRIGADQFGLLGISGGGPYAAMAASALGNRIRRVALVSPVGPVRGRPTTAAGAFHRFCLTALPRLPGATRLMFAVFRTLVRHAPERAIDVFLARAPAADRNLATDPAQRAAIVATFAEGLRPGSRGAAIDTKLFSRKWQVERGTIREARVWIGTADGNVPLGAARLLASDTGATLTEIPEAGHLWLSGAWPEVLDWLRG